MEEEELFSGDFHGYDFGDLPELDDNSTSLERCVESILSIPYILHGSVFSSVSVLWHLVLATATRCKVFWYKMDCSENKMIHLGNKMIDSGNKTVNSGNKMIHSGNKMVDPGNSIIINNRIISWTNHFISRTIVLYRNILHRVNHMICCFHCNGTLSWFGSC